jgi:hypothetical protein
LPLVFTVSSTYIAKHYRFSFQQASLDYGTVYYISRDATRHPEAQIPASDHWLSRVGALHCAVHLDYLPSGLNYAVLDTAMYPPSMGYGLDIEAISGILGSISIACWVVVFSPQIIENYSKKSADGLSIEFIIIWLGE